MQVRSDEEILLARYTRLLWGARWFILIFCFVAMALTAGVLLYFVPEIFEASAQLFVKPKHIESPLEIEGLSPKAYQDMLMSGEIIAKVRKTYIEQTGNSLPPLEKLRNRFDNEASDLQDTTIKKVTSPLINLTVKGVSREEARQLMDLWTRFFIEDYGSVFSKAAHRRFLGQEEHAAQIHKELTDMETELVQLRWELPFLIRQLTFNEVLLSPSEADLTVPSAVDQKPRRVTDGESSQNFQVQASEPILSSRPGLTERLADKKVQLSRAAAKKDAELGKILRSEIAALETVAADARTSISLLQSRVAQKQQRYLELERQTQALRERFLDLRKAQNLSVVEMEGYDTSTLTPSEGSDVVIISHAVTPMNRVLPKRSITCLIAGALAFILSCAYVIFRNFLREVEASQ